MARLADLPRDVVSRHIAGRLGRGDLARLGATGREMRAATREARARAARAAAALVLTAPPAAIAKLTTALYRFVAKVAPVVRAEALAEDATDTLSVSTRPGHPQYVSVAAGPLVISTSRFSVGPHVGGSYFSRAVFLLKTGTAPPARLAFTFIWLDVLDGDARVVLEEQVGIAESRSSNPLARRIAKQMAAAYARAPARLRGLD